MRIWISLRWTWILLLLAWISLRLAWNLTLRPRRHRASLALLPSALTAVRLASIYHLSAIHVDGQCEDVQLAKPPDSEKLTINLGFVDFGVDDRSSGPRRLLFQPLPTSSAPRCAISS